MEKGEIRLLDEERTSSEHPPEVVVGNIEDELDQINNDKDTVALKKKFGSVEGLAKTLGSNVSTGLTSPESIETLRSAHGANKFHEHPPKSFLSLCWDAAQDPIILILIAAATVSTGLGAGIPAQRADNEWIEGVAIWVAVIVVIGVGAGNDYQKDRQFRQLNALKDIVNVTVLRGSEQRIPNYEVVVGDILCLQMGDKVAADGVLFTSHGLKVDEAALTGEGDAIRKTEDDPNGDIWVRSGTQVIEGSGNILVTAVGAKSMWGRTLLLVDEAGEDETPLQEKLEIVAGYIGKVGLGVAVCCFIALLIEWCVANSGFPLSKINNNGPIQFFLYAITIIVVAVPEGLPLAVTISLAYSMKKMMADNNFVRHLAACETMGGATTICSDKTGTLTENKMTVVKGWFAGVNFDRLPEPTDLTPNLVDILSSNVAITSTAFLEDNGSDPVKFVGNRTECALLVMLKQWGLSYEDIRKKLSSSVLQRFDFNSARKMSTAVIDLENEPRVFNKGAAEWVIERCTSFLDQDGIVMPISAEKRQELEEVVLNMAKTGLRCICLAYSDIDCYTNEIPADLLEDSDKLATNLIALAILGIKDPMRKEVPEAVRICKQAGIVVRMVTGDNVHTATHIARECGILTDGDLVMEGPEFRSKPEHELQALLPNLRVLARSSPEDKLLLVQTLKGMREVVAVTGDGTNDAPALKESDVGLAMGIAGTDVAKEAADIIIMDDNFSSIVKSVLWGRSVFSNIQKFLQFQLTVNFVALVVAFVGAVAGGHEPLNVIELLWVNMIMDTMGALALSTEKPSPRLLLEKPHGRESPLITMCMWKHILVQGLYQMLWMFLCLYVLPNTSSRYAIVSEEAYFQTKCVSDLPSNYPSWNATYIDYVCNIMSFCGFPNGREFSQSPMCLLHMNGNPVPLNNQQAAICYPNILSSCQVNDDVNDAQNYEYTQFQNQVNTDYEQPLSVLFNVFIMCQIANEVNSRRIMDEYNIFENFFDNYIFLGVIIFTFGFQAIIINALGVAFQVKTLNWQEWLVSIGIGFFSIPLSLLTRYISRSMRTNKVTPGVEKTFSGRPSRLDVIRH